MVNFTWQLAWAKGCLDGWYNTISEGVSKELAFESGDSSVGVRTLPDLEHLHLLTPGPEASDLRLGDTPPVPMP